MNRKIESNEPTQVYETRDGEKFAGDTAFQVVDAMRAGSSFTDAKDCNAYMKGAAARFERFDGVTPRTDTPENFLADLVSGGVLRKL